MTSQKNQTLNKILSVILVLALASVIVYAIIIMNSNGGGGGGGGGDDDYIFQSDFSSWNGFVGNAPQTFGGSASLSPLHYVSTPYAGLFAVTPQETWAASRVYVQLTGERLIYTEAYVYIDSIIGMSGTSYISILTCEYNDGTSGTMVADVRLATLTGSADPHWKLMTRNGAQYFGETDMSQSVLTGKWYKIGLQVNLDTSMVILFVDDAQTLTLVGDLSTYSLTYVRTGITDKPSLTIAPDVGSMSAMIYVDDFKIWIPT